MHTHHKNAVLITNYVIYAYDRDFLREWEAYCSFDNQRWYLIDHVKMQNRPQYDNKLNYISFHIDKPLICRRFKLLQKDQRWGYNDPQETNRDNHFIIHQLEFFGVFYTYHTLLKMAQTYHSHFFLNFRLFTLFFTTILF